jgi:hypothetical protein
MRTTVDIPNEIYRELKERAARQGTSVKQIILRSVVRDQAETVSAAPRKQLTFPLIKSKRPGSLKLGKEGVYEYIPFP